MADAKEECVAQGRNPDASDMKAGDSLKGLVASRRTLLCSFAATAATFGLPAVAASPPRKIVSLDYGIASTLLSLGVVPAAVSELADWDRWLVEPAMPKGVLDLGSTWEANVEILTMLKPDLILTTPYLDELLPKLRAVGPVLRLEVFAPDAGPILPAAVAATRKLGAALGCETQAERFLAGSEAFFDDCRRRIAALPSPPSPLAMVNFMDARHARIYSDPGLFDGVLQRLGLRNAWTEKSSYWGFETIAIEDLAKVSDPDARLIAFDPIPGDVLPKLAESPLWRELPFARPGHFSTLPPALMFGMVNEAMRFGHLLTDLLESSA